MMVTDHELEQASRKAAAALDRLVDLIDEMESGESRDERRRRQERERRAQKKAARARNLPGLEEEGDLPPEKSVGLGVLKCYGCRRPLRDHKVGECRV